MVFVSGCLMGRSCKYSGGNNYRSELKTILAGEEVILICPEQMGGLETPRAPSEIQQGKTGGDVIKGQGMVINEAGQDVTREFLLGAIATLKLAEKLKPEKIYLKQGSPSCGFGKIYDGTFSGTKKRGNGVTADILAANNFVVIPVE